MRRKSTPPPATPIVAPSRTAEERASSSVAAQRLKNRVTELAILMDEYRLSEAEIRDDSGRVLLRRRKTRAAAQVADGSADSPESVHLPVESAVVQPPPGMPVTSPMNGIFYSCPTPNAPPFVREGEHVVAGQVIGLIEAMKVFNEITASTSGAISRIVAEQGQVVKPGDPLVYITVGSP